MGFELRENGIWEMGKLDLRNGKLDWEMGKLDLRNGKWDLRNGKIGFEKYEN